jgi:hypothetical protein
MAAGDEHDTGESTTFWEDLATDEGGGEAPPPAIKLAPAPDEGGKGKRSTARQTHSAKEMEDRIELTAMLLGQGLTKGQIKQMLKSKWQCSARSCEAYLARAREKLVQWSGQPKADHFIESASFYRSVLASSAPTREKLLARERLDMLYGLEAARNLKVDSVVNSVVHHEHHHTLDLTVLSDEQIGQLESLLARVAGENPPPAAGPPLLENKPPPEPAPGDEAAGEGI